MPTPKYCPETIAAIEAHLAQQCLQFDPGHIEHYKAVATHEAAHIVAGLACDAVILEVEINRPTTTKPSLGGVNVSGLLDHHDAIISLAGWAWEEAHGDTARAAEDLRYGKGCDSKNFDRNLQTARRLVRDAEAVIKACAAALMKHLNRRGKLSPRNLTKVLARMSPHARGYAHYLKGH